MHSNLTNQKCTPDDPISRLELLYQQRIDEAKSNAPINHILHGNNRIRGDASVIGVSAKRMRYGTSARKESVAECRQAGMVQNLKNAEKRVKQLEERDDKKSTMISNLQFELNCLRRNKNDANEYENKIATLQTKYEDNKLALKSVTDTLDSERRVIDELNELLAECEERESQFNEEINHLKQTAEFSSGASKNLQSVLDDMQKQKLDLENDLRKAGMDLEAKKIEILDLHTQLEDYSTLKDEIESRKQQQAETDLILKETQNKLEASSTAYNEIQKAFESQQAINVSNDEKCDQLLKQLEQKEEANGVLINENEDLQNNISRIKADLESNKSELASKLSQLERISEESNQNTVNMLQKEAEITMLKTSNDELRNELNKSLQEMIEYRESVNKCKRDTESITRQHEALQELLEQRSSQHKQYRTETESKLSEKEYEMKILASKLDIAEADIAKQKELVQAGGAIGSERVEELEKTIKMLEQTNNSLKSSWLSERQLARELQGQIHTLKGNMRVIARVRPMDELRFKKANMELSSQEIRITESKPSFNGSGRDTSYIYKFDRVFGANSTNAEICEETDYLVQSSLDGHNVCIFAYGQTGSGKTYTMSNPDGVNSYALKKIMSAVEKSANPEYDYDYKVSMVCVEIHNEKIRDLLQPNCNERKEELQIKNDQVTNMPYLSGATSCSVEDMQQALKIMHLAVENRSVSATAANMQSSRSHLVFTIKIERTTKSQPNNVVRSLLNLVDLAGSERLTHSLATGDRLEETKSINTSLSALGGVINALIDPKKKHYIPYRSSKLTYLLQSSLSGSAKVMVVIALSPEASSLEVTKGSLRFADKASKARLLQLR